jgi:hypothetical protein
MTREEAIHRLKNTAWLGTNKDREETEQAVDMAIEALQREEAEEKGYCHRIIPSNVEVVVRCKDCRHRDLFSCPLADNDFQKDEDFCSWGERREE